MKAPRDSVKIISREWPKREKHKINSGISSVFWASLPTGIANAIRARATLSNSEEEGEELRGARRRSQGKRGPGNNVLLAEVANGLQGGRGFGEGRGPGVGEGGSHFGGFGNHLLVGGDDALKPSRALVKLPLH